MNGLNEALWLIVLLTLILLTTSSRLQHCIRNVALQGFLVGIIPLAIHNFTGLEAVHVILAVINVAVKAVALPAMLRWTMKKSQVERELEPLLGYSLSLFVALALIAVSFGLGSQLPLPDGSLNLAMPVAFSSMFIGLFIIMARRKTITQIVGFLTFENGITLFATALFLNYGVLVELGILLDVFVLVFIMAIQVFNISSEYKHIDADKLNQLGDAQHTVQPQSQSQPMGGDRQ